MEKQKKQFLGMLLVLAVLAAAYGGIHVYNQKQEEKEASEEEAEKLTVVDFKTDDVTAFSYVLGGQVYAYTKTDGEWTWDGDISLTLDTSQIDAMLDAVPADAILDAPPGVSCPAVTVTRDVDLILLVADPTPFGFHDFRLAHQAFLPLNKAMAVVINRAGAEGNADGDAAVRDYCREHGLPLLAELPFERAAAEQYANGRLLAALSPEWKQRFEHLRDALRRLGGEVCHA